MAAAPTISKPPQYIASFTTSPLWERGNVFQRRSSTICASVTAHTVQLAAVYEALMTGVTHVQHNAHHA